MIDDGTRDLMNSLAELLNGALAPLGFALLVFDMDTPEPGGMTWICNAERRDMVAALKEMTAVLEGRRVVGPRRAQ